MKNKILLSILILVASQLSHQAVPSPNGLLKRGVQEKALDDFILAQIPGFQEQIEGTSMFLGTFGLIHSGAGTVTGNVTNIYIKGYSPFDFRSDSDLSTMGLVFTFNFRPTVLTVDGNYAMEGSAHFIDETILIPVKGQGALKQVADFNNTFDWVIRAKLEIDSEGYAFINPNITRDGESYGVISTFEGIENFEEIELMIVAFLNLVGYTIFSPIFQTLQLRLGVELITYLNIILKTVTLEEILGNPLIK